MSDRSSQLTATALDELSAALSVVAETLGLNAVQASADYIHLHQGSAELLAASLGRSRRVAGELLAAAQAEVRNPVRGAAHDTAEL